jgi:hypothetical protein
MVVLADLIPRIIRDTEKAEYQAKAFLKRKKTAFDNGEVFPHLPHVNTIRKTITAVLQNIKQQEKEIKKHEEIENIHLFADIIERDEITAQRITAVVDFLQSFRVELKPVLTRGEEVLDAAKKQLSVNFVSPIPPTFESGFLALHQACIHPRSQQEKAGHFILAYDQLPVFVQDTRDRMYRRLDAEFVTIIDGSIRSENIREFLIAEDYLEQTKPLFLVESESREDNSNFAFRETVKPIGRKLVRGEIKKAVERKHSVE